MGLSQRHHYLPEVYLKGFTGDDGKLSVYDVQKKELRHGRFSPKQIFYEWDRNTFIVNGSKTDFLEEIYKDIDQKVTPVLKKIQGYSSDQDLYPIDYFNLIFFLGVTYWRIPSTDKAIIDFVKTSERKDLFLKIFDTTSENEVPKDVFNKIVNDVAFIESYRIPKVIIDYLRSNSIRLLENWKTTYSESPPYLHLVGDNPILTFNDIFDNIFETETIFPISSSKYLWHMNGEFPKLIPPELTMTIDQLIFLQSEKYVCGPNPEYLSAIVDLSNKKDYNENIIKYLKHQVFHKI